MTNMQLITIDMLNRVIELIDEGNLKGAKMQAMILRDDLQEEVNKAESDIDIQLQLENESKYGK